jgi:hypothetical protein
LLSHGLSMWLYIVLFLASNNTVYLRVESNVNNR